MSVKTTIKGNSMQLSAILASLLATVHSHKYAIEIVKEDLNLTRYFFSEYRGWFLPQDAHTQLLLQFIMQGGNISKTVFLSSSEADLGKWRRLEVTKEKGKLVIHQEGRLQLTHKLNIENIYQILISGVGPLLLTDTNPTLFTGGVPPTCQTSYIPFWGATSILGVLLVLLAIGTTLASIFHVILCRKYNRLKMERAQDSKPGKQPATFPPNNSTNNLPNCQLNNPLNNQPSYQMDNQFYDDTFGQKDNYSSGSNDYHEYCEINNYLVRSKDNTNLH